MKCEKCTSAGIWMPVLGLQVSVKSPAFSGRFHKIALCEMHKDLATLTEYLSSPIWDRITRFMAENGKPVPKRSLTTLTFEPIEPVPSKQDISIESSKPSNASIETSKQ
jgi:hypothetical protein